MKNQQKKEFIKTSIDNIRKAHNENYLSIFAGAGISAESKLPKWGDLINELQKRLYGETKKNEDYLVLAEKFYNQFGESFYYQTLKSLIPDSTKKNDLHLGIVKLNIKNLITTNWDNLFEQAINEEGRFFNIIKSDKDIGSSTGFAKFIKMHGSLDENNIVFKEQDYLEYSNNFPLIENYIKGVFSTDTVILLGYSLSDQKDLYVKRLEKITPKIYLASVFLEKHTPLKSLLEKIPKGKKETITYHNPCHAKKTLNAHKEVRNLLNSHYEIKEMPDNCCGFGGITMQTEKAGFSLKVGLLRAKEIMDTKARILSAECGACHMQLNNALKSLDDPNTPPFLHPLELIAKALKSAE